jgi:hypothetical protein
MPAAAARPRPSLVLGDDGTPTFIAAPPLADLLDVDTDFEVAVAGTTHFAGADR